MISDETRKWLQEAPEPWVRYRLRIDLLDQPESDPGAAADRAEMLAHPQVQALVAGCAERESRPIGRHNDASHPIHKLSTLADFGLRHGDPGMQEIIQSVLEHQSAQGAFQSLVNIAQAFGGSGQDQWAWMSCDAPTLLYALLAFGLGDDPRVQVALEHLASLVEENGYRCVSAPEVGKFRGPGRKADPCPIANLYALKAFSCSPAQRESPAARLAAETLLQHWQNQAGSKLYMFGIGSDFRKLKYPFIWYDILHVVDVLCRFPYLHADLRFQEMVSTITTQADAQGRYTAGSMYQAWKGWSFADKKNPSAWLTFLVERILKRLAPDQVIRMI